MEKVLVKKYKLYFLRFFEAFLAMTTVLLFMFSVYLILGNNTNSASFFATLTAIPLAFLLPLIAYIHDIPTKNKLIEPKLNDKHFVDRNTEYFKLSELLHQN